MHGLRLICRVIAPLLWATLPTFTAHAQPSRLSFSCVQEGGPLKCRPPIAGPWRYFVRYNKTLEYPDEASAYEHLLQSRDATSVFTLVYRWGDDNPLGWRNSRSHGIENASWKIYRRCLPDPTGFDCEVHPEYLGYQRVRDVSCPTGYAFGNDPNAPYCLPQEFMAPAPPSAPLTSVTRR